MGNNRFLELKTKYNVFKYNGYNVTDNQDSLNLVFNFEIPGLSTFTTTWEIAKVNKCSYDASVVDELAFSLGLIESLSIWKLTCAPNYVVECHKLNADQTAWFKKLLIKGMGEFFYRNDIDINAIGEDIINITSSGNESKKAENIYGKNDKVLIPIGGGKDSAVTLELLKNDFDRYGFIINPRKATLDTFEKSGLDKERLIIANRVFDEKIVKYNAEGFLNGHTPFSALVSFASTLSAYVNDIDYVALSNESSANESTVKGQDVNHQYSKTYEYETDFIDYEKKYVGSGVSYFSLLRPLSEVGIAKIFSKFTNYHMIFRSCNVGSKEDVWCSACPKCLFVYIILSPFMDRKKLISIFGKDMLDDMNLKDIFDKLIGKAVEKPFECVGSRDEVNAALKYLLPTMDEKDLPQLLKYYGGLNIGVKDDLNTICNFYDEKNHLPDKFISCVKKYLK